MTEYCAVIGTHSTVRGDKLLYGQIPDPFPQCGIGSGHARLMNTMLCISKLTDSGTLYWSHLGQHCLVTVIASLLNATLDCLYREVAATHSNRLCA